jgi:putative transposase
MVPSCAPEYTTGLSIVQHRAIRTLKKGQLNKRNAAETLMRGKLEMIDMYEGFLKGNLGKKNVKAAQQFGALTSSQTLLSPTASKQTFIPHSDQLVDSNGTTLTAPHEIPSFSSFSLEI